MIRPNLFLYIILLVSSVQAQIQNQYYFLKKPSSNLFETAFNEPNGVDDPNNAATNAQITKEDLDISESSATEYFSQTKDNSSSYLFGTWENTKNLTITGQFSAVKITRLKDKSFPKIKDNLYHVVEALSADSVTIAIKRNKDDTVSSEAMEKIVKLFASDKTAVAQVLGAIGNDSILTDKELRNALIKLTYKSQDSIALTINNNRIYYAARYMKVDPSEDNVVKILGFSTGIVKAPECAPKISKDAPPYFDSTLDTTETLLMDQCDIDGAILSAYYAFDLDKKISNVFISRIAPNQVVMSGIDAVSKPTEEQIIYISPYIDFKNRFKDKIYRGTFQFVVNQNPDTNIIENVVAKFDYAISFNPRTGQLRVLNWDKKDQYYQTCFYYKVAKIRYFPN